MASPFVVSSSHSSGTNMMFVLLLFSAQFTVFEAAARSRSSSSLSDENSSGHHIGMVRYETQYEPAHHDEYAHHLRYRPSPSPSSSSYDVRVQHDINDDGDGDDGDIEVVVVPSTKLMHSSIRPSFVAQYDHEPLYDDDDGTKHHHYNRNNDHYVHHRDLESGLYYHHHHHHHHHRPHSMILSWKQALQRLVEEFERFVSHEINESKEKEPSYHQLQRIVIDDGAHHHDDHDEHMLDSIV